MVFYFIGETIIKTKIVKTVKKIYKPKGHLFSGGKGRGKPIRISAGLSFSMAREAGVRYWGSKL